MKILHFSYAAFNMIQLWLCDFDKGVKFLFVCCSGIVGGDFQWFLFSIVAKGSIFSPLIHKLIF
jgi:hypothetical protein